MKNNPAITVKNVSKTFQIPHEKISTLRGAFVNAFRRKTYEKFKALDNISFEVKKGEFFGIIGRNGSGKSTLLKLLANIYTPDTGKIKINGRISPFLELGIGFNPELSGRDNIYLNAAVLGLTRKQIDEKFAKIVAFSELERFIDQKIKNYSSGMQVRLAFSVAIHANRDILLMDEVLAVGDTNFQQKCLEKFNKYREQGKTVILVTHDMGTIQRYCNRVILLRNGKIELIGSPLKVVEKYVNQNMSDEEKRIKKNSIDDNNNAKIEASSTAILTNKNTESRQKKQEKTAKITKVEFLNKNGGPKNVFGTGEDITIRIHYYSQKSILKPVLGIAIYTQEGVHLTGPNTRTSNYIMNKMEEKGSLDFVIKNNPFYTGIYDLTVALYDWECLQPYDIKDRAYHFKIFSKEENQLGMIKLNHLWKKIDLLDLPFDQYSRNYIISKGIEEYKKKNKLPKVKILDIGGRAGKLEQFIAKDDKLTLLDIRPGSEPSLVLGDGTKMTMFRDNSFDVVVSSDVFEHVPPQRRSAFVNEATRVSSGLIILAAPFNSPAVKDAEETAASYFQEIVKKKHIWLEEHIKNGLPEHKELENLLIQKNLRYEQIFSNNIQDWLLFQLVIFFSHALKIDAQKLTRPLFRFYNENFLELEGKTGVCYRRVYFIVKKGEFQIPFEYTFNTKKHTYLLKKIFSYFYKFAIDKEDLVSGTKNDVDKLKSHIRKIDSEAAELKSSLKAKSNELTRIKILTRKKSSELESLSTQLKEKEYRLAEKEQEIALIRSSKFWKLRNRYTKLKSFRWRYMNNLTKKALFVAKKEGLGKTAKYFVKYLIHGREYFQSKQNTEDCYREWIARKEIWSKKSIAKKISEFDHNPKISIITPVYNVDPGWLDKCINSVINQLYSNWELCLHNDASTKKETVDCLKKWENYDDKRIKISWGENNQHISGASNEALKLATGKFILLLDNDDELPITALYEYVRVLNENPKIDFIYSDEDKINENNQRSAPFFKPDWSPDLFLSMNYVCHSFFRKSIVDKIGGFRKGYEGAQDYDLALRFIEKTSPEKIHHIPKILYHWRQLETSTSTGIAAKNYTVENSIKALNDYLVRNRIEGVVREGLSPGRFRVRRTIMGDPRVSIIIPFRDQAEVLKRCIESIFKKTDYKNYEIVLVNNQSVEAKTLEYIEKLKKTPACRIIDFDKPFNFSAINNFAVKWSNSEYILFLNNDTEVINTEWLSAMMEQIQRPEVGAVGAKLIYPSNKIQHAGVMLGTGIAGHAFKHLPAENEGYMSQANTIKNYSAVTAACLLTKKSVFFEVAGFDENNFSIAYNDVDLCLKMREKGYLIVYTPYAKLYHHESLSRGDDEELKTTNPKKYQRVRRERIHMFNKWKKLIKNDPYYNPHLTRLREDFSINLDTQPPRYI